MRILMCGVGDGDNFKRTVLSPVDLREYASQLTFTQRQLLDAKHGQHARVWGFMTTKGTPNATAAAELQPGDQVWFHGQGKVTYIAEVVTIFRNVGFDEALWPDVATSGFVFTLTSPQPADIPKEEMNSRLGYHPQNRWRPTQLLTEEQTRKLTDTIHLAI